MTSTLLLIQAVGGGILFVAQITGLLQHAPWLFFATMFIMATGVGTDFVPQTFVQMEVVDYGIYKTGKDRSALTTVADGFITKMQTAFSTSIVGLVLTGIGYTVEEGNRFAGDVSQIPTMLNWFIVIMGLVPAVLGIISVVISCAGYNIITAILAIIFGAIHLGKRRSRRGMAIAGIVLGIISIALFVIVVVILAVAIGTSPDFMNLYNDMLNEL